MTSILSQENRVVNATNSNAIFSKSKKNFSIFSAIPELAYNLEHFEKKRWVSEVDCKNRCYLNAE